MTLFAENTIRNIFRCLPSSFFREGAGAPQLSAVQCKSGMRDISEVFASILLPGQAWNRSMFSASMAFISL